MAAIETWSRYFPDFAQSQEASLQRLMAAAKQLNLPAGQTIFQPGGACGNYLLVLEGSVRSGFRS